MKEIKRLCPTNVLVQMTNLSEEKLTSIENYLRSQHKMIDAERGYKDSSNVKDEILLNATDGDNCLALCDLAEEVKMGFLALAYSNLENLTETRGSIKLNVEIKQSKLNILKSGDMMGIHTHFGDDAFACIYFNDVASSEGGDLMLYDPRWQKNYWFGGSKIEKIRPQRGLIVIAPSFMWHEVATYSGKQDRVTLVYNGQIVREAQ